MDAIGAVSSNSVVTESMTVTLTPKLLASITSLAAEQGWTPEFFASRMLRAKMEEVEADRAEIDAAGAALLSTTEGSIEGDAATDHLYNAVFAPLLRRA